MHGAINPAERELARDLAKSHRNYFLYGVSHVGILGWLQIRSCSSLPASELPITFSHPALTAAAQEQTREASAEKLLVRQGSSLEAALIHSFDKEYTQGTSEIRQQMKAFVIDVALGDVTPEIGKAFNQYSLIGNEQLRSEQFQNLMEEHAGPAARSAWSLG